MPQQGTYTAYRQLKPLEGDISQDIQQQEENGFRRRAIEEQRAKNKADSEAKVKELKQKELENTKYPSNPDVKVQTLTDYGAKALRVAANRIGEISGKLYSGKLLPKEDEDALRVELNNLQKTPETLVNSASALTAQANEYHTRLAKGEIRPNLKFENFIKDGATGWEPHYDSSGNLMTAFMDKDVNEDGVVDKLDLVTYADLAGHTGTFKFDTAYDRKKLLELDIKSIEPPTIGTDNGLQTVVTKGYTKANEIDKTTGIPYVALDKAKNTLYNQDGTPSDVLRDFSYTSNTPLTIKDEKGVEIPNQKGLEKLVLDYAREINSGLEKSVITKQNDSALDYQREKRLSKEPKEEPSKTLGAENITRQGFVVSNGIVKNTAVRADKGAKAYSVEGTNLERAIGDKGAYERVQNIYVMANGKDIAFAVDQVDGTVNDERKGIKKSNTKKVSYTSNKDPQEIADFVTKKINPKTGKLYKSTEEFMEDSFGIKQKKSEDTNSSSNKITKGQKVDGYQFLGGDPNDPKSWKKI